MRRVHDFLFTSSAPPLLILFYSRWAVRCRAVRIVLNFSFRASVCKRKERKALDQLSANWYESKRYVLLLPLLPLPYALAGACVASVITGCPSNTSQSKYLSRSAGKTTIVVVAKTWTNGVCQVLGLFGIIDTKEWHPLPSVLMLGPVSWTRWSNKP
eukprot:scaffold2917_cov191-Amphora_coffeaeformis.AAC.4